MTSFLTLPDLASRLLGGGVIACNDEFFAPADRLVAAEEPTFSPKTFGTKGQVYDGWETRRRREPGHDWAIVRLGVPGLVRGVVIDTSWFTGNFPPHASVEGCAVPGYPSPAEVLGATWRPLLERVTLAGDSRNTFALPPGHRMTHVRLSIYPDGGVARLRVHGEPDPPLLVSGVDLAATEHGGRVVDCSDMFYSSPSTMLMPGPARSMGDGWETKRRRDEGNDWVLIELGLPGVVRMVEVDTSYFKGNAPGSAAVTGVAAGGSMVELLPRTRLQPDTRHRFPAVPAQAVSRVRLDIFPDGGMARLRVYGTPAPLVGHSE